MLKKIYRVEVLFRNKQEWQIFNVKLWFWKKPSRTQLIYNFRKQYRIQITDILDLRRKL